MTSEEWKSLTVGSIVSNLSGNNHRVIICKENSSIKLPTNRDRAKQGYTVYCSGDKNLFKLVKVKLKLK